MRLIVDNPPVDVYNGPVCSHCAGQLSPVASRNWEDESGRVFCSYLCVIYSERETIKGDK